MSAPDPARLKLNVDDLVPGAVFAGIGGFFLYHSLFTVTGYPGDVVGPATFSTIISLCLLTLAAVLLVRGFTKAKKTAPLPAPLLLFPILVAPILFGLLVRGAGFAPALLVSVLVASMSISMASVVRRIAIVVGIVVLCMLIFHYAVNLPYPLVGPWLRW